MFALSYGAFEIPSGAMGDRLGPRRVLTRIVLWWSAFTSLTGVVSNYYFLLIARFCFGMGEAGAYPNASAAIARWFAVPERGRALWESCGCAANSAERLRPYSCCDPDALRMARILRRVWFI
jgi:MFS family permease